MATQQIIIGGSYQTPPPVVEQLYEIPGSYTFVVPSGLNPATISVVAVGGGGSGGDY